MAGYDEYSRLEEAEKLKNDLSMAARGTQEYINNLDKLTNSLNQNQSAITKSIISIITNQRVLDRKSIQLKADIELKKQEIEVSKKRLRLNRQLETQLEAEVDRLVRQRKSAAEIESARRRWYEQTHSNNMEEIRISTVMQEEVKQKTKSLKFVKFEKLATTVVNFQTTLGAISEKLQNTQKDLGISMGSAATLQASILQETIQDMVKSLQNMNYSAIGEGIGDMFGLLKDVFTGKDIGAAFKNMFTKLNETIDTKAEQILLPSERLDGIKSIQDEFGVINEQMGEQIARTAKEYGVNAQQLTNARRTFVTITRGDLSQVGKIQTKFFQEFKSRGMTPKVALEAVGKYAELIARNGTRFADSFVRAAAEAKKIGVDLSKIDQVGDNIISNFEGFLEKQAELGSMGFQIDTARLAQIAITGDTGALFDALRSELMGMGKDITKLSRPERLALEGAYGINISELARAAGLTPQIKTQEDYLKGNNTKLGEMLKLLQVGGPLIGALGPLASILTALGPTGILAGGVFGIFAWMKAKGNEEKTEIEKNKFLGKALLEQAKSMPEGTEKSTKINQAENYLLKAADLEGRVLLANSGTAAAGYNALNDAAKLKDEVRSQIYDAIGSENVFKPAIQGLGLNSKLIGPRAPFAPLIRGDDVISQPGYGKRSLVTPSGVIALNNKDNIVAYADDFMGNKKLPIGTISNLFKSYRQDGVSGLKSNAINAGLGMLGKKIPALSGIGDMFSTYKEGGLKGIGSSLLTKGVGALGKKIPGLSGAMSAFSAFKEGGVKGVLGSLAKGGIGKSIGGLIGSAIPIPGVGTMVGSLLGSKVGKLAGRLFGKKKGPSAGEVSAGEPISPSMGGVNLQSLLGNVLGNQQSPGQMAPPPIDTSGIEKQLSAFIQALSSIEVKMDGAKVGTLLVNADQMAASTGVFRAQR